MTDTTITTGNRPDPALASIGRPPAPALAAASLAALMALVGGYGAIYFSGLEGWEDTTITYVTTYESIVVFALVSAVALLRGSDRGRAGLAAYGLFMIAFTTMKLVSMQEWEAIPFGVVGALVLGLVVHPRTRAFTR